MRILLAIFAAPHAVFFHYCAVLTSIGGAPSSVTATLFVSGLAALGLTFAALRA
jgi:hypothetical protein